MKSGVYIIWCKTNQKFYVGSTSNIKNRLTDHKNLLRHGTSHNSHLQNAWNLYGSDAFIFYAAEYVPEDQLLVVEQEWIDLFWETGRLFNKGRNAERSSAGLKRDYMKGNTNALGYKHTPDARRRISEGMKEVAKRRLPMSKETREKISLTLRGNKNWRGNKWLIK